MNGAISETLPSIRDQLEALVGTPYGDPRFEPADCWGFVRYCYSLAGITLPKRITAARKLRNPVKYPFEPTQLLDVIYFQDFLLEGRHVGIALDSVWLIQSSATTNGVAMLTIERVSEWIDSVHRLNHDYRSC